MAKIWKDHKGNEIPEKYVPELDKIKDKMVLKTLKQAKIISAQLAKFKKGLMTEADIIFYKMLEEANIDNDQRKGNLTICSFDKSIKVEIKVSDRIQFDDNITLAQAKLSEYIDLKMEGTDRDIAELINSAFQTDKGKLDNKRIFSLFRMKIKHPLWIEAIELIKKSIQINSTTKYITVYEKDADGKYQNIDLNMSSI